MDAIRGRYAGVLITKDGQWKSPFKGPKQFAAYLVSPLAVLAEAIIFIPFDVTARR